MRRVHPIEAESYRILREQVDLSRLGPLSRAVAERVIHASADLEYAESLVLDEAALRRGLEALRRGARVVTDVGMVAAGFTLAEREAGFNAVWVVGNAPTALFELLEMDARPALVVGLPVGFVGAAESKESLIRSGLPAVTNHGPKGGSAVAAAALNALLYFEEERFERSTPGGEREESDE